MNRAEKRRQQKLAEKAAGSTKPVQSASSSPGQQTQTIQQALGLAVQHHTAGRLPQAESIYQQILQSDPNQPVALRLLGVIFHQVGKSDTAVDLITKALAIKPDYAEAHSNLGNALKELGKLNEAVASYHKALAIKPDLAEAHYNLGNALKEQGKLDDAVASYHKALAIKPDYAAAHSNLGLALKELGKLNEAVASYHKALAIKPDYAEAHSNLGNALQEQGKLDEAVASHHKALAIKPDLAEMHNNLGNALQELGKLEEAVASYHKALAIKPDYADAHSNFGLALQEQGKLDEAVASHHKALAIKPDYADAHNNLGNALKDLGEMDKAFACHRRAIALNPRNELFWSGLAASLEAHSFTSVDDDLWRDLLALIEQPTLRPSNLIRPIISALRHDPDFSHALGLTGSGKPDTDIDYESIAGRLSTIPLFLRIMTLCPLHDLEIERMLMHLRRAVLRKTLAGKTSEKGLPFSVALALQCFTNEYVFPETAEETASVEQLQRQIAALVEKQQDVPPTFVATLGAYRPLYDFPWAQQLSGQAWTGSIGQLVERQILEPQEEQLLRSAMPCLTPIENRVSQSVREQYEENPYPRWVNTSMRDKGRPIGAELQRPPLRLDLGDYESPERPEILIAGCGTGQHALTTASRFKNARVLALDLSLSSLSYAWRMTKKLNVSNIEYAQADILELGSLDRRFDLIESAGVLHHLGDPLAGWQVLVGLLRPGGLMKIGLYSETARRDIVAAREMIAEKGYSASAEDIRRCRQDIIAMAEGGNQKMAGIFSWRDFFSLSECRDLLFHVQEHRFTLPQIEAALEMFKLKFLGFEFRDQEVLSKFRKSHQDKSELSMLPLWRQFEFDNPKTFEGMYQFWCKKI